MGSFSFPTVTGTGWLIGSLVDPLVGCVEGESFCVLAGGGCHI